MPTNLMKLFSDDMIHEILPRLPPKSVLRFRCLSRSLCSKIDGGEFTKLHLNHSLKYGPYETLVICEDGQVQLVEHCLATPKVRRLTIPLDPAGSKIRLCGSCHGLIALHIENNWGDVVVWNPFTDKHKMVPAPETENSRLMWPDALGFGYDPLTSDYKQVRIDKIVLDPTYGRSHQMYGFQVRVYSFKSNIWRKVNGPAFTFSVSSARPYGVFFRGALHFAVATWDPPGYPDGDCILAFNLGTEEFRGLAGLPSYGVAGSFQDVKVLRDQLCALFILPETREIEAWAMTDYGGKEESWTKLLRVALSLCLFDELRCLLDYSENGRKFLVHGRLSGPVWVDLERRTTEDVAMQLGTSPCPQDSTLMAGTFVSLDV